MSVEPGSQAAKNGIEPGDLLTAAWNGQGQGIDISPDAGEAALGGVLALRNFKMTIHRPSLAAAGEDPIINLHVIGTE